MSSVDVHTLILKTLPMGGVDLCDDHNGSSPPHSLISPNPHCANSWDEDIDKQFIRNTRFFSHRSKNLPSDHRSGLCDRGYSRNYTPCYHLSEQPGCGYNSSPNHRSSDGSY